MKQENWFDPQGKTRMNFKQLEFRNRFLLHTNA